MIKAFFLVLIGTFIVQTNSGTVPYFPIDVLLQTVLKKYDSAQTDPSRTEWLTYQIKVDQPVVHQYKQSIMKAISTTPMKDFKAQTQLALQHIKVIKADDVINEIGTEVLAGEYRVRQHSKVIESSFQAQSVQDMDHKLATIAYLIEQFSTTGDKLSPAELAQILPLMQQFSQEVVKVQKQMFQIYYNELEQIHLAGKELDLEQKYQIEVFMDYHQYVGIFVDTVKDKL